MSSVTSSSGEASTLYLVQEEDTQDQNRRTTNDDNNNFDNSVQAETNQDNSYRDVDQQGELFPQIQGETSDEITL